MNTASTCFSAIREACCSMRRASRSHHRDIAEKLAISEGELIAAHVTVPAEENDTLIRSTRLRTEWVNIIAALEPLGEVMALTRNASCVHEKIGVYRKTSCHDNTGLVLGGEIDLRIFYKQWRHGFAVSEMLGDIPQRSLQFFDASGTAIHKIFLKPQSDIAAYAALVERFADTRQNNGLIPVASDAAEPEQPDNTVDIRGFRDAWSGLRDTHDFFGLLKRFGVSRMQALRLADPHYVQQVDITSAHQILDSAASEGIAIMVFVGNAGMIQIHTGTVHRITLSGPWVNVQDSGFNLHLREDHIASAWVVRKPTVDGLVTSLELFDKEGKVIAMFFGERKPGKPERCEWRTRIESLLAETTSCVA